MRARAWRAARAGACAEQCDDVRVADLRRRVERSDRPVALGDLMDEPAGGQRELDLISETRT